MLYYILNILNKLSLLLFIYITISLVNFYITYICIYVCYGEEKMTLAWNLEGNAGR